MAARRIDVAKGKTLALEVGKRLDRRCRGGDEERMELAIALALHERRDVIALMRLDVSEAAEIGEVEGAVAERLDGGVVVGGNDQLDVLADCLLEIVAQW